MRGIIDYFVKNEIAGNMLMIFLFIVGILGALKMKSTFFPEVESRIISIQTIYPGSSPEEVEEGIITKIEENLKGITGVERTTSTSSENTGTVTVEVLKGYNTDLVLTDVKNAVDRISSFPAGMEPPVVYKSENLGRAITFSIYGDVDLNILKRQARIVENDLLAIDGISKISLTGFPDEEIEIAFREVDLRRYNLTFSEAVAALRQGNVDITGGTLKTDEEEFLIRARNKAYIAIELGDIIISSNEKGGLVRLHQVATLKDKWADVPSRTYLNSNPSVVVTVQNTLEEDMLTITEQVREYIDQYNEKNIDTHAEIILDSSVTLRQRIELLQNNGLLGFFIVLILLAIFLHWRLAFWVALAIPISFAGMFLFASAIGVTINVISLFGMILVIGILVDDGIVIAENIYQHYEDGAEPLDAAINGTMEVLPAVFSAILTTIVAFSAFFFIDGRLGDFFQEMAIVVIFSLIFSLVEGALILPAHVAHSKALKRGETKNWVMRKLDALMTFLRDTLYAPALKKAISYPLPTLAISIALFLMTLGALQGGFIKTTFFPVIPRENFSVNLQLPSGTREHITDELLSQIEKVAWEINDSLSTVVYNGDYDPILKIEKNIGPQTHSGSINVTLLDGETRDTLSARKIINLLRTQVGPMPEAESLTYFSGSPFGKPVSISLIGNNYKQLNQAVDHVKSELSNLSDLKDVVDNNQAGLREINVELTPKAYNLGFTINDIVGQIRQGFFGAEVQRLQRGVDEVKVWVRYGENDRKNLDALKDMRIKDQNGRSIPLSELARYSIARGVVSIDHLDGRREIKVEADIANDDVSVSDLTTTIKADLVPGILANYPEVTAIYEGQNREQAKTQESMQFILPIILGLMFFIIVLTFKSISQALLVFLIVPFGFVGVGVGHYLHGLPVSLFSFLGIIALIGVLVNDALVFLTTFNTQIKQGTPVLDAIYKTGVSRFRPILLTTITTVAGLAPLIAEKSFQAQFLIPMAIAVAYGLLVVTFIILLLVPAMLVIMNTVKTWSLSTWEGRQLAPIEVEPAYEHRYQNYAILAIAAVVTGVITIGLVRLLINLTSQFF